MKILKCLAFPFIWLYKYMKAEMKAIENETLEEWENHPF